MGGDEEAPLSDSELADMRKMLKAWHSLIALGSAARVSVQIGKYLAIAVIILWALSSGHIETVLKGFGLL